MTDTNRHNHTKTRLRRGALGAAAAALVLTAGLLLGRQYQDSYRVDSIVESDVNPSIELKLNRQEKVLSAKPLKEDARIRLDGMELNKADLSVALNAPIGSMLKKGYIQERKTDVPISVEHPDAAKSAALSKRLTEEIRRVPDGSGVCIGQAEAKAKALQRAGAAEADCTFCETELDDEDGRMVYEIEFACGDVKYEYAIDAYTGEILECDRETVADSARSGGGSHSSAASEAECIAREKAVSIALEKAGLTRSEATLLETELERERGRVFYEVEFTKGPTEYEAEIDAVTGSIVKWSCEIAD